MVFQRAPQKAHIWGWSRSPGATVTARFNGKVYTTTASNDGSWGIFLDPTPAGGPHEIQVSSSASESATLQDVLFGEVWVCGGQSNMQMTVDGVFNATEEVKNAANYPNIRVFTVGTSTTSATPLEEFHTISQPWAIASPASVGVGNWSAFSAACWFFGRDLYNDLKVPIGLLSDNWGGTPVQAWSSPDALAKCKAESPKKVGGPSDPSQLWNAMIVPILRMTIKGATWYQGEANAGQPDYYACAFPAMINDWRLKWAGDTAKDFSFHFVQLAPWLATANGVEATIRLAQMYATALHNVGVATAMDWGDPTSPFGSIHPRYKQIVGERLHLVARGMTYNEKVQYRGPQVDKYDVTSEGGASASVLLHFAPNTVGSGLVTQDKKCDAGVPVDQCAGFEIGTSDGKWSPATATIRGETVSVTASVTSGTKVTGVRYGWANYPVATIYNKEGLPALPFAFPDPIKPSVI